MRVLDSSAEGTGPPAEVASAIAQHHARIVVVILRRKARAAFSSLFLESEGGKPVRFDAPPVDSAEAITRKIGELVQLHSSTNGAGLYEIELQLCGGQRGPEPKPVLVTWNVVQGSGPGNSEELLIFLATFCARRLDETWGRLSELTGSQAELVRSYTSANQELVERERRLARSGSEIEIRRMELAHERDRLQLAREALGEGRVLLRKALGKPATSPSSGDEPKAIASGPVVWARELGQSLTPGQIEQAREKLGSEVGDRLQAMRDCNDEAFVLETIAALAEADDSGIAIVYSGLTAEQAELVEKLQNFAAEQVTRTKQAG